MTDRVYHCPICGMVYSSLSDMYECAKACEAKEKEEDTRAERERDEREIQALIDDLKDVIANYNETYQGYGYCIEVSRITPNSQASAATRSYTVKGNKVDKDSFESFLKKNIGIKEPQNREWRRATESNSLESVLNHIVEDEDVELFNLICGKNYTKQDYLKNLMKFSEELNKRFK